MTEKELHEEIKSLNEIVSAAKDKAAAQVKEIERLNVLLRDQYSVIDKVQAVLIRWQQLSRHIHKDSR